MYIISVSFEVPLSATRARAQYRAPVSSSEANLTQHARKVVTKCFDAGKPQPLFASSKSTTDMIFCRAILAPVIFHLHHKIPSSLLLHCTFGIVFSVWHREVDISGAAAVPLTPQFPHNGLYFHN